jgi:hypothetical protein
VKGPPFGSVGARDGARLVQDAKREHEQQTRMRCNTSTSPDRDHHQFQPIVILPFRSYLFHHRVFIIILLDDAILTAPTVTGTLPAPQPPLVDTSAYSRQSSASHSLSQVTSDAHVMIRNDQGSLESTILRYNASAIRLFEIVPRELRYYHRYAFSTLYRSLRKFFASSGLFIESWP